MLDRRSELLDNLDLIKKAYLNLIIIKQLEEDACESVSYKNLHELSENERVIIEDINGIMKYIVPDLVFFREDRIIKAKYTEIDRLLTSVIQRSLQLRKNIENRLYSTKKNLDNLKVFPKSPSYSAPNIVNLRA